MKENRRLTVILPVRGRPDYTERWLAWARASDLPFPVIVADGSGPADAAIAARAVAAGAAEGRPWSHRAFAPGDPHGGFQARLADAAAAVATPYAVLSANDDFPLASGLLACADALDADRAASACGGPGLALAMPPEEPVWSARARVRTPVPRAPVRGAGPAERVEALLGAYDPLWYDVHRAGALREAFALIERSGVLDLNLCELLHAASVAAAGPVLRIDAPHLARQEDVSGSASTEIAERGDLLTEILSEGWGAQLDAFVRAAAKAAGGDAERTRVRAAFVRYARTALARTPGFAGRPSLRRRFAARLKSALGPKAVGALRRARGAARLSPGPASAPLAPLFRFLARAPEAR